MRFAVELAADPPATAEELTVRCRAAGVEVPDREIDLDDVRSFLVEWLGVVDAPDDVTRADRLNELLAAASAYPRLTNHDGDGWHVHYRAPDLPLAGVLRALISVGTALHLTGRGMHRLGRCAVDECRRPFADVSRTGRQRYCSPACANKDAVRRHRARTR
ncbi:CGNR zinc finger domain-containing protein [Cryptosporangium aurantiacum]|uniref:CGNR zinc finger domain-containing protein n=1 Tax=Cryptosporangium aurantiacum TaxID=134849 RepID=A0A1M7QUE7_9ACTN|nr:CGNR zinc finger domain-containing protein [Cryptosporangium aurantiacum]